MSEIDQLKEQLREAKSQSRVNGQHRMLYQGQRDELRDKLVVIKNAFQIHYSTLHDSAWMDSKKMLKALDETAEEVKKLLEDQSSGETPT